MNSTNLCGEFDLATYNSLIPVEEADKIVRTEYQLGDFLEEASKLFLSYNLQSRFGVSLLHKHSLCMRNERMIEYAERIADRDALVTRPSLDDSRFEQASPVVWQIHDEKFYPLEFSKDPLACSLLHEEEIPDGFLDEFRDLTNRFHIDRLVGLAVVDREFYNSASQDEVAVEYYEPENRSNIVVMSNRSRLEGKTIETAWSFEENVDSTKQCVKRCRKMCWSVEGGHQVKHEHLHAEW